MGSQVEASVGFGIRLSRLLRESHPPLNAEGLGRRLGLDPSEVRRWIREEKAPSRTRFEQIVQALDLDGEALLRFEQEYDGFVIRRGLTGRLTDQKIRRLIAVHWQILDRIKRPSTAIVPVGWLRRSGDWINAWLDAPLTLPNWVPNWAIQAIYLSNYAIPAIAFTVIIYSLIPSTPPAMPDQSKLTPTVLSNELTTIDQLNIQPRDTDQYADYSALDGKYSIRPKRRGYRDNGYRITWFWGSIVRDFQISLQMGIDGTEDATVGILFRTFNNDKGLNGYYLSIDAHDGVIRLGTFVDGNYVVLQEVASNTLSKSGDNRVTIAVIGDVIDIGVNEDIGILIADGSSREGRFAFAVTVFGEPPVGRFENVRLSVGR